MTAAEENGAAGADEIVPDTKDWTWVIQRRCPDCGFEAGAVAGATIPTLLRGFAARWVEVLRRADVARRPARGVWSPLEYACHVRDVCRVFRERAHLMLTEDEPTFANWDQDAAAVAARYGEQEPVTVAGELREAADAAAQVFAGVSGDQWSRRGVRSNGSTFTVETLGQYFLHDLAHHLWDVRG
jgi:hypothetical protein